MAGPPECLVRLGVRATARAARTWLRGRTARGGLILLYHRIASPSADPWRLSVSARHFDEHLQVLKRRGVVLNVRDVAAGLRRRAIPRRFLAVTFDDGYEDNLTSAKPLLERHGVPATVFVSAGWLGRKTPFWWDDLQELLLSAESLPEILRIDTPNGVWEHRAGAEVTKGDSIPEVSRRWHPSRGDTPTRRQAAYLATHAVLSSLGPSDCERGMSQLRSQIAGPAASSPEADPGRPLSPEQTVELARGGLVEIGAHAMTHTRLARLSPQDQRLEIADSRRHLESLTGAAVTSFAYPFGGSADFTSETASIVEAEGFSAACAATAGRVREAADLWRLPRFHVEDFDGDELDRRISRWFAAA